MSETKHSTTRREFLGGALAAAAVAARPGLRGAAADRRPNLLYVFADQWRAQAMGYAGDPNAATPNLDALAGSSLNLTNAVSTCPVSSPYRASLLTGRYPLSHGVFLNDVYLQPRWTSFAQALGEAGYDTGYIGKWHLDGHGSRSAFIPRDRRQGFAFWRALECTHDYNNSAYWGDEEVPRRWEGYDAIAQTREAQGYLRARSAGDKPFALFLSWGPPHDPYQTAPPAYRERFAPERIVLRPNVPAALEAPARAALAGYYAHAAALDACMGDLLRTLDETGLAASTVVVFTSDHGDMLFSHGGQNKQQPWEESIRVPFLVRCPAGVAPPGGRAVDVPLGTPDIMPTLLGLCGVPTPESCEGTDWSAHLRGQATAPADGAALIACPSPFGQWTRARGGCEYRGIRTGRYTSVRSLAGPWLLYDNESDPYQLHNLAAISEYAALRRALDATLNQKLRAVKDEFWPGPTYIERWGYTVDASGTVPYKA